MYKYLIRLNVKEIDTEGRVDIIDILHQDKGQLQTLSQNDTWYYFYLEYETIQEADKLVGTLLKIKEVQKKYPDNHHINECFIITNKLEI